MLTMTTELQVFTSELFGELRVIEINGKPFTVANDVLRALGYSEGGWRTTLSRKCKGVTKCNGLKVNGIEVNLIPEGDIYRLIAGSKLPQAEKFESWVFDTVIPTILKTGGFIANPEIMINTYFNTLDDNHKQLLLGVFQNVKEQQKIITEQKQEINHKSDVISGLIEDIPLASKRQILNRVVMKCSNFNDRWKELYFNFEQKYHLKINARMESYNKTHKSKLRSKLEYIEEIGMIDELYKIACKLYESEVNVLVQEMYELHKVEIVQ